ncbi:40S ribosomal protein S27 [Cryptococcus sp. DSM 104548]
MPPKGSTFRGPNAQHFQLVHRSQQDPLINDPDVGQRVLKAVSRGNEKKAELSLAELEASLDKSKIRSNEGEAALYGITYDDSAYDYMQHLKPVGGLAAGGDSWLIAAPKGGSGVAPGMKGGKQKSKGAAVDDDMFKLPETVLPSKAMMSVQEARARSEAIPTELQGLQPDMDPHLRQVLEALDDDEFVDDGDDEDWFGDLVKGGERSRQEEVPWEFAEWGVDEQGRPMDKKPMEEGEEREETWEDRFKAFKAQQHKLPEVVSEAGDEDMWGDEERSEMADTIGSLASNMGDLMVQGGKKRRGKRGPSDASGMSMSSSSMFRTQGLRDLDDRFDKIEMDYLYDDEEEEEEEWDDSDDGTASIAASNFSTASRFSLASHASRASNATAVPPELSRDDFESIMDDFLDNYEVVGRRLRPALGGTTMSGPEKLKVLRTAIEGQDEEKEENRKRIMEIEKEEMSRGGKGPKRPERTERVRLEDGPKWDVESVLSTRTNTENHPGMIRNPKRKPREPAPAPPVREEEPESDSGSETEREGGPRVTIARQKGEATDEKKARKAAVKAERAARRAEKKSHTETFATERKKQLKSAGKMVADGKAADVPSGREGVVLAVDLVNQPASVQARTHKLKKIVPEPNSFFMDVKCPGCFAITTVFSHASTVVQCQGCATALCQPTGGKAKLTEGCSFRRKN